MQSNVIGSVPPHQQPCTPIIVDGATALDLARRVFPDGLVINVGTITAPCEIDLTDANVTGKLEIYGAPASVVPITLKASTLTVIGSMLLRDLRADGVVLDNATIHGDLEIVSSTLGGGAPDALGEAVYCRDIRVSGSAFIRGSAAHRTAINGRLYLAGARIEGTLEFAGVDFSERPLASATPKAVITAANARIGGDLAWRSNAEFGGACSLAGRIKLDSSRVGGRLRIDVEARTRGAISMRACSIGSAMQIYSRNPATTLAIDASDAEADAIVLHGYKAPSWTLQVRGMRYGGLAGKASALDDSPPEMTSDLLQTFQAEIVRRSANWERDPDHPFSPQPYQTFIALCRAEGYDSIADEAVFEWIKRMDVSRFRRAAYNVFGGIARYGLSPWRITWVTFSYWVFVMGLLVALSIHAPWAFVDPQPVPRITVAAPRPKASLPVIAVTAPNPPTYECVDQVSPGLYALEMIAPGAAFQQSSQCPLRGWAKGPAQWPVVIFTAVAACLRLFGTILSAILILTFSGINRRIWK